MALTALLLVLAFSASASAAPETVWTWGHNAQGQLGNGTTTTATAPVSVTAHMTAVAGGYDHSLALLSNGEVAAWGDNSFGELGDGTTTGPATCGGIPCNSHPYYVRGLGKKTRLTGVVAIAAGQDFSLALLSNGTVAAWGANEFGQLGIGNSAGPSTCHTGSACTTFPVLVSGLSNVKAIAAGGSHALALLNNGTIMAWGANQDGQLGDGISTGPDTCFSSTSCSTTPVPVGSPGNGPLRQVQAIAAGQASSFAIVGSIEQVDTWGDNRYGELGNGTTTGPATCGGEPCSTVPQAISGLSDVGRIAANGVARQALAIDVYGDVIAWGDNEEGQVGSGCSTNLCPSPMVESGTHGATAIATSCGHGDACRSLALLPSGQVVEWGSPPLGNGSALGPSTCFFGSCSKSPVNVTGMSAASAIAAGGLHSLALAPPPPNRFQLPISAHCVCTAFGLKIHVPAPGVLLAFQPPTPRAGVVTSARAKPFKPLIKSVTVHVRKAGTVKLKITLTKAGLKALKRAGRLRVRLRVTFTPNGGPSASHTITITFRRRR